MDFSYQRKIHLLRVREKDFERMSGDICCEADKREEGNQAGSLERDQVGEKIHMGENAHQSACALRSSLVDQKASDDGDCPAITPVDN